MTWPAAEPDSVTILCAATPDVRASVNTHTCSERTRIRYRKAWAREAIYPARQLRQQVCGINAGPIYTGPVTVDLHIRWERGRRCQDPSNLWISAKHLIDILVAESIVFDDREVQMGRVTQEVYGAHRGQPCTELTIRRTG